MATVARPGTHGLTEQERSFALSRFHIIQPCVEDNVPYAHVARETHLSERTVSRWAERYRQHGLAGLCRKGRPEKSTRRMSSTMKDLIEGLALQEPRLTAATIHRRIAKASTELNEPVPSCPTIHRMIQRLDPALMSLAHDGTKSYNERFDLVHLREAAGPNIVWQADHSELDILVKDGAGKARKPWLTVILDDYSRAIVTA